MEFVSTIRIEVVDFKERYSESRNDSDAYYYEYLSSFFTKLIRVMDVFTLSHVKSLTDKEVEILVYNMCCDLNKVKRPFYKKSRKQLLSLMSINNNTFAMHLGNLKQKGWVTEDGDLNPTLTMIKENFYEHVEKAYSSRRDFVYKFALPVELILWYDRQ